MGFWYCLCGFFHKELWHFCETNLSIVRAVTKDEAVIKMKRAVEEFDEDVLLYEVENPRGPFGSLRELNNTARLERKKLQNAEKDSRIDLGQGIPVDEIKEPAHAG